MNKVIRLWIRTFAFACLVVGPIFGVIAVALALHTLSFIHHAAHADALVVTLTPYTDQDNTLTYAPTFTFQTTTGQVVTKESETRNNPPTFTKGQRVSVLYALQNPQDAKIVTTGQLWFMPIVFGVMCFVLTPIGFFWLLHFRKAVPPSTHPTK